MLVVNAKGGCGKTTVATNLCAAYAARGMAVGLVDNDGQGSGAHWTAQRPADAPLVELASSGRPALDRIIIDGLVHDPEREAGELVAM
ncbi:MAG: ParA family protein, partial [Gammaproteobacteria bacterium]|nr:ParA family protein [Gammaproteobacteria bacterium]